MQASFEETTMSITHLTAKAVAIPLKRKTWMSTRALTERQFLLVWLSDDDGVTGMGYSYAGTLGGQLLADTVRDVLSAVVLGSDADDIPGLWGRMYQESILIGWRGAVGAEIAASRYLGVTDNKIKVGGLTVAEDAERVAAAVEAIGGRGRLA